MRTLRAALAVTGAALLAVTGVGAANATDPSRRAPLPVPYSFFSGAARALTAPGAELPGANDWSCRPTADKPRPVVLVHGTSGGAVTNWATYGPLLHNEGYCVYTLTYGALPGQPWPVSLLGGLSDITEVSVPQVGEFVDRVLASTGAEQVDLIGHSQGTLVSGLVAKVGRPGKVNTVAAIAPLWHGSRGTGSGAIGTALASGDRGRAVEIAPSLGQMAAGSETLELLWSGGTPYAPGVTYLNLVTRYDQLVRPYTSGVVEGPRATNITIQDGCEQNRAEHLAIASDPRTVDFVLNALDPADPREPRCEAVAPYLGPIPTPPGS
ncbi:triacylglycerol lipase [Dietzia alimentaria]|uniref:esterase/lipase family protein n=1 Tax=Dietzia kunjamensis TaxID=322509 RepID=UPI00084934AC|nr:alpha/beta fold hydrolase [Dietzia kunjamensis]MCZ4655388.1 alpha/beta fold hydrolase [Dietzia kunjamensis]ODQ83998.1 triacylglycerol lipase [Dietzia alimentaria]